MATDVTPEYQRLGPDASNNNKIVGKEDDIQPSPYQVHLPTKASTVRYVPHDNSWSRYKSAIRTLVPFRRKHSSVQEIPLDHVGLFSYITFNWLLSSVRQIDETNVPDTSPLDSCEINGQRLHHIWRMEGIHTGQLGSSLFTIMWKFVRTRIIIAVIIYILGLLVSILGSVTCLRGFLQSIESNNVNDTESNFKVGQALVWISALLLTELVSILLVAWSWSIICRTAGRLRSATMSLIYNKLVHLSNLNTVATQQMISLLGTDGQKLFEAVLYGPYIIIQPIALALCVFGSTFMITGFERIFDLNIQVAASVFLLIYPLMFVLVRLSSHLTTRATSFCTQRMALIYEMLVHVRLIKMALWENTLSKHLKGARLMELTFIRRQFLSDGLCRTILHIIPVLALILYFSSEEDPQLKAYQVIPLIALFFGQMKDSLLKFWIGMKKVSDVFPSLERFKSIMLLNESNKYVEKPINRLMAVNISKANFVWGNNVEPIKKKVKRRPLSSTFEMEKLKEEIEAYEEPTLIDITFLAPKGKLIGICGGPKCGKSSLLLAILGHLQITCGQVVREGNCAYVGQRPWIWTSSIRDNIVFKEAFHHRRYYNAVHSCCLNEDIDQLPHHDDTQIDEMSLSVGQKQRISLARALYSNRDIYLLDNPLSMVDASMAATVFEKCILKALQDQTVILATRHVQFLTRCDEVYVMDQGKIIESGTHENLMIQSPFYSSIIKSYIHENSKKYFVEESRNCDSTSSMMMFLSQHIHSADSRDSINSCEVDGKDPYRREEAILEPTGSIGAYVTHLGSACNYLLIVIGLLSQLLYNACFFGVLMAMIHFQDDWSELATFTNVGLIIVMAVASLIWCYSFTKIVLDVSQQAHDSWFERLCRAPVGYFLASPAMSCVLNLFSLNVHDIDEKLPLSLRLFLEKVCFCLCAVLLMSYVSPYSLAGLLIIILIGGFLLGMKHRKCMLKLHEVEVASHGPLYQHLSTTITGRTTIQAFSKEREFISDFTKKCDDNATCIYLLSAASCWLAVRIQAVGAIAVSIAALLLVFTPSVLWARHLPSDWIAGLVLLIAMQMGCCLQGIIHSLTESAAKLKIFAESSNCIQGIKYEDYKLKAKYKELPANWPTDGSISFNEVKTKTVPGSIQALNKITFDIVSGQKLGIVGLPGSGKKLIVDALFRLVEITHGKINIGGTDLSTVPLDKLRTCIGIVPQDPVLFTGSIRLNMDPCKMYQDSDLWDGLQKVHLKERIEHLPQKLNTPVDRNGDKLSVGERQLLCLARASLKNIKVLVIEEPLATVGGEMETLLTQIAYNLFPEATILTIAHQMKYIVNCNKIMVVEGGKVVEYDTPVNLYRNRQSFFSQMITASTGNLFETEL